MRNVITIAIAMILVACGGNDDSISVKKSGVTVTYETGCSSIGQTLYEAKVKMNSLTAYEGHTMADIARRANGDYIVAMEEPELLSTFAASQQVWVFKCLNDDQDGEIPAEVKVCNKYYTSWCISGTNATSLVTKNTTYKVFRIGVDSNNRKTLVDPEGNQMMPSTINYDSENGAYFVGPLFFLPSQVFHGYFKIEVQQ